MKNRIEKIRIKYQLLVLVLVAALPALVLVTVSGYRQRENAIRDTRRQCSDYVRLLESRLDSLAESCGLMLKALANFPEVAAADPAKCSELFASIVRQNQQFMNVTAAGADGILFAAAVPLAKPVSVADRKWFLDAVRSRQLSAGEYIVSRTLGHPMFSFSYPVCSEDNALCVVLHVGVVLDRIRQIAAQSGIPKEAVFTITDWQGVILASTCPHSHSPGSSESPEIFHAMRLHSDRSVFSYGCGGRRVIAAGGRLTVPSSSTPCMYIRVEMPEDLLLGPVAAATRRHLYCLLIAILAAVGGSWFIGDRVLGKRIRQLARFAKQVAGQDGEEPAAAVPKGGELGEFATVLYEMSRSLASTMAGLKESEEHFRRLFDAITDAVFVCEIRENGEAGRFLEVNDVACRRLGYTREELLGMSPSDIEPRDSVPGTRSVVQRVLAGETVTLESSYITKDGCRIPLEMHAREFGMRGRKTILFLAHDVSERKSAEAERHRLEQERQQARKLESLSVLAGGIAHDFNNILTSVLGNASLAMEEFPPDTPGRGYVAEIEQAAVRAAELCRQMLAYSGRARFNAETLCLDDLMGTLRDLARSGISSTKIELDVVSGGERAAVRVDGAQIRQLIMNLVINAAEAIGDREGRITISTGMRHCTADDFRNAIVGGALPAGRYVWLAVTDTGCGIEDAVRARMFDPFFSTKFTGRGLGLATVLGIVRGHGGALEVLTEPGRGTTFTVFLPALTETPAGGTAVAGSVSDRGFGRLVLLVDDEETIRIVGCRMLERLGYSVLTARDGVEALDIYRAKAGDVALVLLDMTMPRLGGEETFLRLREYVPAPRVVVMSGYAEVDVASRFEGACYKGFLPKPFDLASLRERLAEALKNGSDGAAG